MNKQTAALLLALFLSVLALTGCHASGPEVTEATTMTSLPPATPVTEDAWLSDFSQRLAAQGVASWEEFAANYQEALDLYLCGIEPENVMPSYAPGQDETAPGDFYAAIVRPDIYGISRFYVLPAGERSLTAEEYLELVDASGAMSAQDLILPENSWCSSQSGRDDSPSSRVLYKSESFWLSYLFGMYYQGQELPAESRTVSALYLPLPVEDAVYTLLPTDHMTPRGLLEYGLHSLEQAPESRRAKYIPPEDTDYTALQSDAVQAIAAYAGKAEDPAAVYFAFTDTTSPSEDARSYSWTVGLLYSDGASYTVRLDGPERTLMTIEKLSDGALDITADWSELDTPQLTHNYIYNG